MKFNKTIFLMAVVAAMTLVALSGCKTTETNYKKAYETAVEKRNEAYTADEVAAMNKEEAIPRTVFRGDSIPLRGMHVNTVKLDPPVDAALRYNVVVASFKQKFNAMSVMTRLRDAGYSNALLLVDRDLKYYVTAGTFAELAPAVELMRELQKSSPVALRLPYPYILEKS